MRGCVVFPLIQPIRMSLIVRATSGAQLPEEDVPLSAAMRGKIGSASAPAAGLGPAAAGVDLISARDGDKTVIELVANRPIAEKPHLWVLTTREADRIAHDRKCERANAERE
jgi:hypothetical protein